MVARHLAVCAGRGQLTAADRAVMAFSFGPFIGFWSAFDAAAARGALVIPTGGMSSLARLDILRSSRATAVFCTPSYALHLAEVAQETHVDLRSTEVALYRRGGRAGWVDTCRSTADRRSLAGKGRGSQWSLGSGAVGLWSSGRTRTARGGDRVRGRVPSGGDGLAGRRATNCRNWSSLRSDGLAVR